MWLVFFGFLAAARAADESLPFTTEVWVGAEPSWTPEAALRGDGPFDPIDGTVAFGPRTPEVWLRLRVSNPTPTEAWVLRVDYAPLDGVTAWVGEIPPQWAGDRVDPAERSMDGPRPAFPLWLPQGAEATVLLRVQNTGTMRVPLAIQSREAYFAEVTRQMAFSGGLVAASVVMGLFQILFWAKVRERSVLYYAIFASLGGIAFAALSGDLTWLLFGRWPALADVAPNALSVLATVAGLRFFATFLQLKDRQPGFARVFSVLTWSLLGALAIWPIFGYRSSNLLATGLQFAVAPALITASLRGISFGYAPSRHFALAWSPFLVGFALYLAKQDGWIPANPMTEVGAPLFFLVGLALLAVSLGARFEDLRGDLARAVANSEATRRLTCYFPEPLVRRVLASAASVEPRTERVLATIVFSDLQGFTHLSDSQPPPVVDEMLNAYLRAMTEIIDQYGGTLDKVMGDGLMVILGAPEPMEVREQAHRAVNMAVEWHAALARLNQRWSRQDLVEPLLLRVGVHTDWVTIGNFGSAHLMSYTAIGRGVNLASRLEGQAKPGTILVSEEVYRHTAGSFPFGPLRAAVFRGMEGEHRVAELDPAISALEGGVPARQGA